MCQRSMKVEKILIKNTKVVLFEDNDVVIKEKELLIEKGKITKIEDKINQKDAYIINGEGCTVLPGLINTHSHIPMSIFRETTEGCSLYKWLHDKIWPSEEKLTEEDVYWASMLSFIEMISTGTTCINDQYYMTEQIRRAAEECKVRAVLTTTLMDMDNNLEQRIKKFINLYESRNKNDELITYSVGIHGLYTCSDKCLKKAAILAKKYNLPIHIHFLESIEEIEDIKKLHGKLPIQVLKKYFDGIHTILAHGVQLNENDVKILGTMDCGISHNPVSNLRLGCKIANTTKYLKNGINVAIRNRWTGFRKQFRYV